VPYDAPPLERGVVERFVHRVRDLHVDQAIVFTSFHQSALPLALLLRLADVPRIAASSDDYPGSLLDVRHYPTATAHEVERSLSLAAAAGFTLDRADDRRIRLRAPLPAWRPFADRYVVVHPGASVPARRVPTELARRTVDALVDDGWRVAVTGAASESPLAQVICGPERDDVVDLTGTTDLASLAGVLTGASAVVTGNTGPAHLAAAVGTPVVSVFAPVVPYERWRPWGVEVAAVGDQRIDCAGCRARACPHVGQPCLASIDPAAIVGAVARLAGQVVTP
jgi:ADP-heptose:LPS heptosyltransferase